MRFNTLIAAFIAAMIPSSLATLNGPCSGAYSGQGACVYESDCTKNGGSYISGFCPNDAANIKCCVKKVQVNPYFKVGRCIPKSQCTGSYLMLDGYCPGNDNVKLCIN